MSRPRLFLFLLLVPGGLLMTSRPTDAADATPAGAITRAPAERLLTDFTQDTPDLGWFVLNDNVMGGRSQGGFKAQSTSLRFTGSTNTNGGGFSSIRTGDVRLDLSGYEGVRLRVKGDGRTYTWTLRTGARWRGRTISYWARFETRKGEWTEARIPFSSFKPQFRGMKLSGPKLDTADVRQMGLMIYDKRDGPFALELDQVGAYAGTAEGPAERPAEGSAEQVPAFSLGQYRWKRRILVLSAPAADDTQLKTQLLKVRATQADFSERDLTLVVVLEQGDSKAGSRTLSKDEARAVRAAVRAPKGAFSLRLIGKDGGVKHEAGEPMAMRDLYAQIDRMPMRRAEMRDDA